MRGGVFVFSAPFLMEGGVLREGRKGLIDWCERAGVQGVGRRGEGGGRGEGGEEVSAAMAMAVVGRLGMRADGVCFAD